MDILTKLGVNSTFWIQLGVFFAAYLILAKLVFGPYYRAFKRREELTVGSEDSTNLLHKQNEELQSKYEQKARALNVKIRETFDAARNEASKEQAEKMREARSQAEKTLAVAREQIKTQVTSARSVLEGSVPELSSQVVTKLIGKDA